MPRYFFDVLNGTDWPDAIGTELADEAVARSEAVVLAGHKLADLGRGFWDQRELHVRVRDDDGAVLFTLSVTATDGAAGPSAA